MEAVTKNPAVKTRVINACTALLLENEMLYILIFTGLHSCTQTQKNHIKIALTFRHCSETLRQLKNILPLKRFKKHSKNQCSKCHTTIIR